MILDFNNIIVGDEYGYNENYIKLMFDYQCHPKNYSIVENKMELQYFGKGIYHKFHIKNNNKIWLQN